jgi:hypothetical protein
MMFVARLGIKGKSRFCIVLQSFETLIYASISIRTWIVKFPGITSIQVITTSPVLHPNDMDLPISVALHQVAETSTTTNRTFGRELFTHEIVDQVTSAWKELAGERDIGLEVDCDTNMFDMYLSIAPDTTDSLSLEMYINRLADHLQRQCNMDIYRPAPSNIAEKSSSYAFIDVHVCAAYAVIFRIHLFYTGQKRTMSMLASVLPSLLSSRNNVLENWFLSLLRVLPLPFPDLHRSTRLLSRSLAQAYVKKYGKAAASMDTLKEQLSTWTKTDWLALIEHADCDPIARCLEFRAYLKNRVSICSLTSGFSKTYVQSTEALVVLCFMGDISESQFKWFELSCATTWHSLVSAHFQNVLVQEYPNHVIFRCIRGVQEVRENIDNHAIISCAAHVGWYSHANSRALLEKNTTCRSNIKA